MNIQKGLTGTAFENGYEILQERGLAIVGMSPGNSYFKKATIAELLRCCAGLFSHVRIMIADKPMEHTYMARGYSPAEAERKARLNGNTLQNHSRRSMEEILGDIGLVEWGNEINPNGAYQTELNRILVLYKKNGNFRHEVRETTRTVLEGKLKQSVEIESAIDRGVFYLLKELAYLSASPKMFGTERIAYIYHNRWEVYEHFVEGKFDGQKRSDLGFVIIK